jgi:hypothetical protein
MIALLQVIQFAAGLVVLAEGLNKLHRIVPFAGRPGWRARLQALAWLLRPWAWQRPTVVTAFKALGWSCLSVGAFGSLLVRPSLPHLLVLAGFALLIVRSRLKEG